MSIQEIVGKFFLTIFSNVDPPLEQDIYRFGLGMGLSGYYFGMQIYSTVMAFISTVLYSLGSIERPPLLTDSASYSTTSLSLDSKINSLADEFLAKASTLMTSEHFEGGRRLGSPRVKVSSNEIQYVITYMMVALA